MATTREVLDLAARGEGPLGRAADDEPVFVLRAQDLLAASVVDYWALEAERFNCPAAKVRGARDISAQMKFWPRRKMPD